MVHNKTIVVTYSIIATFFVVGLTIHMEVLEQKNIGRKKTLDSLQALTEVKFGLERELHKISLQLGALVSYISVNPELVEKEFNIFSKNLFRKKSHIISFGAAPNMVVKYVYPYEKNKMVLGLDYNKSKTQRESAFRAKRTRGEVIDGPLISLQGDNVLIARAPVYLAGDKGDSRKEKFWGIVSVLVKSQGLFSAAGLRNDHYYITLWNSNGKELTGPERLGSHEAIGPHGTSLSVPIPGGSWTLVAAPKETPKNLPQKILLIRLVGLFFCLVVITFTYFRLRYFEEQNEINKKLENALVSAESANRAKSDFLANMSHELRTPLNAIIGFSDMIAGMPGKNMTAEKISEYATDINQSGHQLLEIINDILDLSKVESGNFSVTLEPTYIQDVVSHALHLMRNAILKAELEVINNVPDDLPSLESDERIIRQALLNLLSNAIKFTPAGGSITLSSGIRDDRHMEIILTDTGVGMSEEDLVVAMQNFGQVGSYLVRQQQGTGLGLPLVKAFVQLVGGKVSIKSEVGVGTEVTLTFPLKTSLPTDP